MVNDIIFYIAIAGFALFFSRLKKYTDAEPEGKKRPETPFATSLDEAFPSVDVYNPNVGNSTPNKKKVNFIKKTDHSDAKAKVSAVAAPKRPERNEATKREHIAFRTKSEAKRAFIYSEIFNRKY